jgi:hypothetical protein
MAWNLGTAVAYLTEHAKPAYSPPGQCAQFVRQAIEAGGIAVKVPPKRFKDADGASACDYGASLLKAGFGVVFDNSAEFACQQVDFKPLPGDVSIFQGFEGHRHGHIQMFNGVQWVSDFLQKQRYPDQAPGLYPGLKYRAIEMPFTIYRHPDAYAWMADAARTA